jgi:LCP family protein required for cell wall assembly
MPGGPRRLDGPLGPGMNGGPSSFPQGFNSFNQNNSGNAFPPPAMGMVLNPPQTPGTFQPGRPQGPGSFGGPSRMGASERKHDGPPGKDPNGKRNKKKRRVPIWARVIIGFLLFFLILGGTVYAYYQVNYASSVSHIIGQKVQLAKGEEDPNANLTGGILSGPRINILLLGSDTDQKFEGNHYIAQTDIVVTIDPASHTVGMLSIPRDFYIPVPGYGMHKLDEAYGLGGVDLSRRTIEQDFGIPINYYAWIGLDGFIKVINEVGGVDVDVIHPIDDDNYPDDTGANANDPYALKRLNIPPGPQHLDGPTALEYVRSRHADLVGDFGRSARQQEVLSALKPKLANPDIFNHLPNIAKDLQGYLKTDMELSDVLKLMNFARSLDINKINKWILGPPYSHSGTSPTGASVVIPDCAQILPLITQVLQLGNSAACNVGSSGSIAPASTALPLAYTMNYASAPAANCTNLANMSTLSSDELSGPSVDASNLLGVQGLLDLMLMGVFESPNVF